MRILTVHRFRLAKGFECLKYAELSIQIRKYYEAMK
jgi:hypothetical protein